MTWCRDQIFTYRMGELHSYWKSLTGDDDYIFAV